MYAVVLVSADHVQNNNAAITATVKSSREMKRLCALRSKPDGSDGLPLETGSPSCPILLQLSLFLFLKYPNQRKPPTCRRVL